MRTIRIHEEISLVQGAAVPMRDGTRLYADIYLPAAEGRFPALVVRTPYGRQDALNQGYAPATWYAGQGFAVVVQDVRGRWESEGEFEPFAHEASDGVDTIAWVAQQRWCTGAVGTYGFSYGGATQLLAATEAPPALRAIAPGMTGSNYCDGWTYRGGILQLAFVLSWAVQLGQDQATRAGDAEAAEAFANLLAVPERLYDALPVVDAVPVSLRKYVPYLEQWLEHPEYDGYWKQWSPRQGHDRISIPGLHVAGWYDTFLEGTIENFNALQAAGRAPQSLVVGPWHHMPWSRYVNGVDFGPDASSRIDEIQVKFFRRWLLGEHDADSAAEDGSVQLFVMGMNQWRRASSWPPPGARPRSYFLYSAGRANSLNGQGRLQGAVVSGQAAPDSFPSNPRSPVRSMGGRSCCYPGITPMGPGDQRSQEIRNDVLVYDTAVLEQNLLVVGQPCLHVFVASDVAETQLVVRLVDVHPEGPAINVADGVTRVAAGTAGTVVSLCVDLSPTAIRFSAGHKIRLEITGNSFPCYARHSHQPGDVLRAGREDLRIATIWVFHDSDRPSMLELPVLDG